MKPLLLICGLLIAGVLVAEAQEQSAALAAEAEARAYAARPLPSCIPGEIPHAEMLDVPPPWRQRNYGPSCAWATTISMLRAQGMFSAADTVRNNAYGGAGPHNLHPFLDKLGVSYLATTRGDIRVLEYALKTNRGAGVHWYRGHATMLVGRRDGHAIILDNNQTHGYLHVPWDRFVSEWRQNGGWAWVIVDPRGKPMPESITHLAITVPPSPSL